MRLAVGLGRPHALSTPNGPKVPLGVLGQGFTDILVLGAGLRLQDVLPQACKLHAPGVYRMMRFDTLALPRGTL